MSLPVYWTQICVSQRTRVSPVESGVKQEDFPVEAVIKTRDMPVRSVALMPLLLLSRVSINSYFLSV